MISSLENIRLSVRFSGARAGYSRLFRRHLERQPRAWRLGFDGRIGCLPICFERERDAKRALMALITAGLDTPLAMLKAGHAEVERIIAEAMQW